MVGPLSHGMLRIPSLLLLICIGCGAVVAQQSGMASQPPEAPLTVTLLDAIELARANSPAFRQALVEYGVAQQDRVQTRAGMLPSLTYTNQYLYTEGNGTSTGVFIANNGVHEFVSQADAHEAFSAAQVADLHSAKAAAALARAKQEIAMRGLVVTVVQDYSNLVVAQHRFATAQESEATALGFLTVTQELERGREVAHADVVKAQLQYQDQQIILSNAQLAMEQARLQLALLLFPNFSQDFQVVDNLQTPIALPSREEAMQLARHNNPDLDAALAAKELAEHEVSAAKAAYLPGITIDYFYGIDANHFATESGRIQNLGYAAQATIAIPIWNWGITRSKVQQAELRGQLANVQLQYTQRKLLADFEGAYSQAQHATAQVEELRSSESLATESLRLTLLRYKAGEAVALEVVSAQNAVTQERNALVEAEAAYAIGVAQLQAVTGPF